jgi:serpin B
MKRFLILHVFGALLVTMAQGTTNFELATKATNELGVDLHRQLATGDENLCISPYSIDSALAMTFAGADGETRREMTRVLHFPAGDDVPGSFSALHNSLEQMSAKTAELAKESKKFPDVSGSEPITLNIANRLFAQKGYLFREAFLSLVKQNFGGAFEPLDFVADPAAATQRINKWVADQTRDQIRDLIPGGALDKTTRLVLANALYLKAPWASEFSQSATQSEPFFVRGAPVDVPMMRKTDKNFGYARREGFTVVSLPYAGNDLQFVVLLPDEIKGLRGLESKLSGDLLAGCAKLEKRDVDLHLPKFKLEPPTITLAKQFEALGMKTAFNQPKGSANFDKIAPRTPDDYLYISQIFHKTFIAVDEKGTEAAAATAVAMMAATGLRSPPPPPIEVKVDRPFVYAIQHVPSGVCLFLGRVTDPR